MTRGFTETEMARVAGLIDDVLTKRHEGTIARVKRQVRELTEQLPPLRWPWIWGG